MEWLRVKQIVISLWRLIIISTVALLTFVSGSFESMSQNDFRYMSYHDLLTTASRFYDQNVATYSRFHFDESKSLMFVGARDRIYRFSLQLDLMQTVSWEVPMGAIDTCLSKGQSENDCRNYIMSIHTFNNKLFVCGSFAFSPSCSWRKTDTLELLKEEKGLSPFNPHSNITTLMMGNGNMFIGSTIDFSGSDSVIARIPLRTDLSMDSSKILRTKQYNNLELNNPHFVGSFEYGEFVYFVFRETSIEMASFGERAIYSRIGRVCKNDSGGFHIYKENWTSFLKARLNCSLSGGETPFYFDEVQDITFLPDDNELYATFSTPDNSIQGSAVCVFSMSSIEKAFEGPVKFQIAPGSPVWQQKVIDNRDQFECRSSLKSSSNFLDTSKYQLMARSVIASSHDPLYIEKLEKFVHIAVTKISTKLHENVKIIFAANSDGFIKKISILPRTKQSCLIEVLEPEYVGIKVLTMKFIKSTESLYVGTKESIMKIPSQHCSRHLSKVSCINSMDPYCGWNDLTLTCGMAPNGNSLTNYWYQNATACPILSSPVDGAWSSWTSWFKCAKSDPTGSYSESELGNIDSCLCRTRTCDNPAPKYGGKKCEGHSIMVTNCTEHGGWSDWSPYGPCSQTCGVAIKVRRRTCSNPAPKHNGRLCIGGNQQEIYCTDLPPCPTTNINMQIDGGWSEWNEWSSCSAPCGGGFRIRERKCNNPAPQNNGLDCIGCNMEYEECNKQVCNEVKKLTSWTNWLVSNSSESGHYFEKRYRYMCKAHISDPADLKVSLYKEETRACNAGDPKCRRVNVTCDTAPACDPPRDCSEYEEETRKCHEIIQFERQNLAKAGIQLHWMIIIATFFGLALILTSFATKYIIERKHQRLRSIQGSSYYFSSRPNHYSSIPNKDYSENNKPKRQPSFSGTSTMGRSKITNGTLNKSNNNLLNQNTPKILKFQNDTEMSTLKRNSALNNMRLKQIEDDKDKY